MLSITASERSMGAAAASAKPVSVVPTNVIYGKLRGLILEQFT
jgi:hypothetical protein